MQKSEHIVFSLNVVTNTELTTKN